MKDGEVALLLSLILRHEPERIGLTLDGQGWANVPDLIRLAKRAGKPFDLATLQRVVEMNDKRRFTLSPGRRQMVHLSADRETAQCVGERHGKAVILAVEAGLMFRDNIPFYQADNGVWLVPRVSSAYLAL